jgi:hypothetical protein
MPKKSVFYMRLRDGELSGPIKFDPIIYTRHSTIYRFALHKAANDWVISDPISGFKIGRVSADFKGCPVKSGFLTLKQARLFALSNIDSIVDRVGFDQFCQRIENARLIK